jgi:hypothetical protein
MRSNPAFVLGLVAFLLGAHRRLLHHAKGLLEAAEAFSGLGSKWESHAWFVESFCCNNELVLIILLIVKTTAEILLQAHERRLSSEGIGHTAVSKHSVEAIKGFIFYHFSLLLRGQ